MPTFQNAKAAFGSSGVVFGVMSARMMLFTEAELKFQRRSDKSLFGTEALAKLEEPWPGAQTGDLRRR